MLPSRIDLSPELRTKIGSFLNPYLASVIDLQCQFRQAHWNVKGPNFIALHKLFEEMGDDFVEHADTIAERITSLGGTAEGTIQVVATHTMLNAYSLQITSGRDHVESLANQVALLGKYTRHAIEEANELGDADTADLLTGLSRDLDKKLWFLESHLHESR